MPTRNPYLLTNRRLRYDYLFGFRAWGLILYGSLPASLFALGVLKVTSLEMRASASFIPLILLSIVPVTVLFLLIRKRLEVWYLMKDNLEIRSCILTVFILVFSTLISLSGGVVTGRYQLLAWQDWLALDSSTRSLPLLESLLISIMALVGSSTLFLTAVKESGGLPGLPSEELVEETKSLRGVWMKIQNSPIWHDEDFSGFSPIAKDVKEAKEIVQHLSNLSLSWYGDKDFYHKVEEDFGAFERVLIQVENVALKWHDYFDEPVPAGLNPNELKLRKSAHHLEEVRFHA